jgi:uncharacterized membrane protein YkgB
MQYKYTLEKIDSRAINFLRRIFIPSSRLALFVVYFWFGILKVIGASPASPMVLELLDKTMPFMNPDTFLVGFGLFEVLIGIFFLIPRLERLAIILLIPHLITTVLPLFVMQNAVWTNAFVPTLEGQYIIKNILIVALAIGIAAHLRPKHL